MKRTLSIGMLIVASIAIGLSAACAPVASPPAQAVPTATADIYAACPTPTEGTSLYVNADQGYCLLYPSDFTMSSDNTRPGDVLIFTSPIVPPGEGSIEMASVYLRFEFNGSEGLLTSRAYAEKWMQLFGAVEGYTLQDSTTGGQASVVLTGVPGMYRGEGLFVVANGARYLLIMFPVPGDVPAMDEVVNRGWNTITGTLAFFPPQAPLETTLPSDVCPQETADARLYVNEGEGYCFLYPSDFSESSSFRGMFVGGLVLVNHPDFGEVYTSINVGSYGYMAGQSPRAVIASWMDQIDQATLTDLTIGGYPAVSFTNFRQPWNDRTAFVNVDDFYYTILAQPYEPNLWPDGIPYLERAWSTVVNSLRFFDPWR
jgi:hypothetical protein